jgi:hypothetical protein
MNIERLLYKSFDTDLSGDEKQTLDDALRQSAELRKLKEEIFILRNDVKAAGNSNFSAGFEMRVLNEINRLKVHTGNFTESLTLSFRKIAFSAAVLLVLLVGYNLNKGNNYIIENLFGISDPTVENAYDPTIELIWTASK